MPQIICATCGRTTNSVCSNFHEHRGQKVTKCYAAFKDGEWVKGCGFDSANDFNKGYAMTLITGKALMDFLKKGKRNG